MATQTLPQVVPFPQVTKEISQAELAYIAELRRRLESAKAELETGAPVEPGVLQAFLKVVERRSVPWKQVVERELGEAYATRVLAATKPETYVTLVVKA